MATPANAVVTHRVTRQQLHDAGLTLQQYQDLLDDINNHHNPEVSSTDENLATDNMPDPDPNLIASLAGLRALAITLPKFDGNSLIPDWLEDFDRYSDETARTADANKLFDLISHLGPEVKQWFHLLPNDTKTSYVNLRAALKDRYTPTSQEILEAKGTIYAMKQGASQTFKDFVKQVQLKARQIDMSDDEVKGICIKGARPHLKAHLAMAKPANMDALLKLPVVVSELSTEEPILQMFQVLNDKFDSLETTRRENRGAKQVTFDDRRSTSWSPSRQGRNRRDHSPGPQHSWDRTTPPATWEQTPPRSQRWPQPWQQSYGPPPPPRYQQRPFFRPQNQYSNSRYNNGQGAPQQCCGKCGRRCLGNQMCPAYQQQCHHCGKLGHFKHMCFSAVYQRQHNGRQ